MIVKIVLENFLSYGSSTLELLTGATIAVVGDNGVGKSALLESIPYAYFGIGREDKEGMSRINGDGSHRVEIWDSDGYVVIRGRKSSGVGFTEVRNGDTLVAKGNGADEWIVSRLGMTSDTFMLTAFFGMGDSYTDKLLHVLPAARLEALQELAQVGPYKEFLSKVKSKYSEAETIVSRETARGEGASSAIAGASGLDARLVECETTIRDSDNTLVALRRTRAEYQTDEGAYLEFVREKERVHTEIQALVRSLNDHNSDIEGYKVQIADNARTLRETREAIAAAKKSMDSVDCAKAESELESVRVSISEKIVAVQLRNTAVALPSGSVAECPLCNQRVTDEIVKSWRSSVAALTSELEGLKFSQASISKTISEHAALDKRLVSLNETVIELVEETEDANKGLAEALKDEATCTAELSKKRARFSVLSDKLGEDYTKLLSNIEKVLKDIDVCADSRSRANGEIIQIKAAISRLAESKKVLEDANKAVAEERKKLTSLNILKAAWSRYGIPLQLVTRLNARIQERATAMYQEFDNGRIDVREVDDRGKPGVQFFLVDRKGERTFGQLSMGEKIMFFISIRVAIAQIVAEDSPIRVDFLVLDEVLGNLSPKRRDDLVRLINKSLRKVFPQLLLVTHTAMPEIFDRSVEVTMQNDVSSLRIL